MKSNFFFLETDFPVLAQFGQKAEAYLYSDSNSCLMKLGMIGETVVNLMFTYDRITLPIENTAVNRITTLFGEVLLLRLTASVGTEIPSIPSPCRFTICSMALFVNCLLWLERK